MSKTKRREGIASDLETVKIADLKPHPRNYRRHPDDQIEHLMASIKEHGLYRNVVVARDLTILAGHGVTQALQKLGVEEVRVARLDVAPNSAKALKVLAADNEIQHLVESDDRALSELLKEISEQDDLLGTGYDKEMLAALAMVARPASEIASFDEAAAWVGMPEYEQQGEPIKVIVTFQSEAWRAHFFAALGIEATEKTKSVWYPPKSKDDPSSVAFTEAEDAE